MEARQLLANCWQSVYNTMMVAFMVAQKLESACGYGRKKQSRMNSAAPTAYLIAMMCLDLRKV